MLCMLCCLNETTSDYIIVQQASLDLASLIATAFQAVPQQQVSQPLLFALLRKHLTVASFPVQLLLVGASCLAHALCV